VFYWAQIWMNRLTVRMQIVTRQLIVRMQIITRQLIVRMQIITRQLIVRMQFDILRYHQMSVAYLRTVPKQ